MKLKQARLNISKHGSGYLHELLSLQDSEILGNTTFPLAENVWQFFGEVVSSILILNEELNRKKVDRLLVHSIFYLTKSLRLSAKQGQKIGFIDEGETISSMSHVIEYITLETIQGSSAVDVATSFADHCQSLNWSIYIEEAITLYNLKLQEASPRKDYYFYDEICICRALRLLPDLPPEIQKTLIRIRDDFPPSEFVDIVTDLLNDNFK